MDIKKQQEGNEKEVESGNINGRASSPVTYTSEMDSKPFLEKERKPSPDLDSVRKGGGDSENARLEGLENSLKTFSLNESERSLLVESANVNVLDCIFSYLSLYFVTSRLIFLNKAFFDVCERYKASMKISSEKDIELFLVDKPGEKLIHNLLCKYEVFGENTIQALFEYSVTQSFHSMVGHLRVSALYARLITAERNSNESFLKAVRNNSVETVQQLLKFSEVDPSARHNEALVHCCREGYLDIMTEILAHEMIDPAFDSNLAVRTAAEHGRTLCVSALLRTGRVNAGDMNDFAVRVAFKNDYFDTVKVLLGDSGVNPVGSEYAMYELRKSQTEEKVQLLVLLNSVREKFLHNEQYESKVKQLEKFARERRKMTEKLIPKHEIVKVPNWKFSRTLDLTSSPRIGRKVTLISLPLGEFNADSFQKLLILDHENVSKCFGGFFDEKLFYIISEEVDTNLASSYFYQDDDDVDISRDLTTIRQIAQGLHYIHSKGVNHGDLRPENVGMRRSGNGDSEQRQIVLTNFFSGCCFGNTRGITEENFYFVAPEELPRDDDNISEDNPLKCEHVDMYSFGILVYCMVFKKLNIHDVLESEFRMKFVNDPDGFAEAFCRYIHSNHVRPQVMQYPNELNQILNAAWREKRDSCYGQVAALLREGCKLSKVEKSIKNMVGEHLHASERHGEEVRSCFQRMFLKKKKKKFTLFKNKSKKSSSSTVEGDNLTQFQTVWNRVWQDYFVKFVQENVQTVWRRICQNDLEKLSIHNRDEMLDEIKKWFLKIPCSANVFLSECWNNVLARVEVMRKYPRQIFSLVMNCWKEEVHARPDFASVLTIIQHTIQEEKNKVKVLQEKVNKIRNEKKYIDYMLKQLDDEESKMHNLMALKSKQMEYMKSEKEKFLQRIDECQREIAKMKWKCQDVTKKMEKEKKHEVKLKGRLNVIIEKRVKLNSSVEKLGMKENVLQGQVKEKLNLRDMKQ